MLRLFGTLLLLALMVGVGSAGVASPTVRDCSGGSITFVSDRSYAGQSWPHMEVDAIDPCGTRMRQLVRDAYEAAWSPDGKQLAFLRGDSGKAIGLYVIRANGGGARRLVSDLGSCPTPNSGSFSWSPDGSTIAFLARSNCRSAIWGVDVASGKLRRLRNTPTPPDSFDSVAWSPNGRRIAFVESAYGRTGAGTLSVMSPNGAGLRVIDRNADVDTFGSRPSWAPDGNRLIYGLHKLGVPQVFRIVDVRSGRGRSLTLPAPGDEPTWSPDGRWIAFSPVDGVLLVRTDGKGIRRLMSSSYAAAFAWSPDSKSIAIEGQGGTVEAPGPLTDRGPLDIWIVPIDGRPGRRITQGWRYGTAADHPQWHPTGAPLARLRGPYVSPGFASDSVDVGNQLKTTQRVAALAADGSHAAIAYDSGNSASFRASHSEAWGPIPKTITVLGEARCSCFAIAIAGDRVAELYREQPTIHNDSTGLLIGSLSSPRMIQGSGTVCSGGEGLQCLGLPIDDLRASGSDLVFDIWTTPCQLSHPGCTGRPKTNGRLFRLDGTHATQIASSTGALTPLSVDAGRILVDHEDGTMDIRRTDGATVRSFSFDAAAVKGARLQGRDLVVQTPTAVEVTDADTGVFERRWPLPALDAKLTDLQDGIVVLVAGDDIHLLRLSDGADKVIHASGNGSVLAQLEPAGLFYATTVDDGQYPGRVVFVPRNQLPVP